MTMRVLYANIFCYLLGSISWVPSCVSFSSFLASSRNLSLKVDWKDSRLYATKKKNKDDDDENNKKSIDASKKMALEGVLSKIERSYGRGSVVKLGDADSMKIDSISSGSLTLGTYSSLLSQFYLPKKEKILKYIYIWLI